MTHKPRRVVITGLGLISPLGLTVNDTWNSIITGTSGIAFISCPGSPSLKVKIAGEVRHFNPSSLPGKNKTIKLMNRDSQLAVAATHQALTDAGFNRETIEPASFGIAFGAFGIQYTLEEAFSWIKEQGGIKTLNPIWPLTILPNMSLCHSAIIHARRLRVRRRRSSRHAHTHANPSQALLGTQFTPRVAASYELHRNATNRRAVASRREVSAPCTEALLADMDPAAEPRGLALIRQEARR